ncbi:MFS transporter [Agromyces kandeliae]|uniref:MFS transporter n=1 Tax=Agromyces kandeliae TaxID=2666141 RepID=UPI001E5FFEC4|nr:MFS transporter [Agromyces kandeliae]
MGVFAFGETMLQPTIPAMYNDLASDRNRGRVNMVNAAAVQGGAITGPIVAGLLLDQGRHAGDIATMVVGCGVIAVLAIALERRLPAAANGVPEPSPTASRHPKRPDARLGLGGSRATPPRSPRRSRRGRRPRARRPARAPASP